MTAAQLPLWPPGWEQESCADADADERAFTDLHGPQPARRAVGTREPHTIGRRVRTVRVRGEWL
jgi:hypothetical protein